MKRYATALGARVNWRSPGAVWRDVLHALPPKPEKYVVWIEDAGGMAYLSTRSWNNGWLDMGGETVTHWLDNLRTPTQCRIDALCKAAQEGPK